jgi:hypothetical protein
VIYSGLDWSEDIGEQRGCIAMVHFDETGLSQLEDELAAARRRLGRAPDYVFKHVDAKTNAHEQFYAAISNVRSFRAHVYIYDRTLWTPRHAKPTRGDHCICDGIVALSLSCPEELVADQTLYIDLPRKELGVVRAFAKVNRQTFRVSGRRSFRDIKPRPDDRLDGTIVQVADMIAGEVREQGGAAGPYLSPIAARIEVV